jgi:hypothetical protein
MATPLARGGVTVVSKLLPFLGVGRVWSRRFSARAQRLESCAAEVAYIPGWRSGCGFIATAPTTTPSVQSRLLLEAMVEWRKENEVRWNQVMNRLDRLTLLACPRMETELEVLRLRLAAMAMDMEVEPEERGWGDPRSGERGCRCGLDAQVDGGMVLPVFDETPHNGSEEVIALFSEGSDSSVFDEMPLENVIWDEESGQRDLLDQLAQDEDYLVVAAMKPTVHTIIVDKQLQYGLNQGCFEMPANTDGSEDLFQNHDAVVSDVKIIEEDEFILTGGKDGADREMPQADETSEEDVEDYLAESKEGAEDEVLQVELTDGEVQWDEEFSSDIEAYFSTQLWEWDV